MGDELTLDVHDTLARRRRSYEDMGLEEGKRRSATSSGVGLREGGTSFDGQTSYDLVFILQSSLQLFTSFPGSQGRPRTKEGSSGEALQLLQAPDCRAGGGGDDAELNSPRRVPLASFSSYCYLFLHRRFLI